MIIEISNISNLEGYTDIALNHALQRLEEALERDPENPDLFLAVEIIEHELDCREMEEFDPELFQLTRELERQLEAL